VETLSNGIKDTQRRTRVVGRTLKTVEALDFSRAEQVLGLSGEAIRFEADLEGEGDTGVFTGVDGHHAA
jgi:hypothetical protein